MSEAAESPTVKVPARTAVGTNWTGAFLLYAKKMTLQEISKEMGIDFKKLKTKCRVEDWDNLIRLNEQLAIRAPDSSVAPTSAVTLKDVEKRIEANREGALKVAHGLRAQINRVLDAYSAGDLFLPVQDISKLATAARAIDECAMMALGDDPAPKILPGAGAKLDAPKQDNRPVTHFHIHPPAHASRPRVERTVGPEVEHAGRAVDAIMTPGLRVEMEPTGSDEDDDPAVETASGRSSVDFAKLAREVASVPIPATGIPDFAKAS